MSIQLLNTHIDQANDIETMPLVKPLAISPSFVLAMKPTPAWLAAAQLLLADVRDEIGNLVTHQTVESIVVSRQGKGKREGGKHVEGINELVIEASFSDKEIDDSIGEDVDYDELVDSVSVEDSIQLNAKVGSSLEYYFKQLRKLQALTLDEEQTLVRAAQAGEADAVNLLVSKNLRVVPAIARTFIDRGLPLEDLIEEGNLGLYRAIPRFNLKLGHRFATYASWWVKHEIRTAVLNQGRLIRLPIHIFKALSRVRRQLESVGQSMPSSSHVSNDFLMLDKPNESLRFTLEEAQVLLKLTELPLSLDVPIAGDPESTLADTLSSETDAFPEYWIQQKQRSQLLNAALAQLISIEREVVLRRYGFSSAEPETLQAIGKSLKLTAERVRQVQKQALHNIQQHFQRCGLSLNELL